jgi:hypothetical protein
LAAAILGDVAESSQKHRLSGKWQETGRGRKRVALGAWLDPPPKAALKTKAPAKASASL